ncbi:MAG TPA: hypothetical protein VET23_09265 [Chitinophagaceae bacterium]|nr:hypothetical protein [Chitinophagaceae bacterium]
MDNQTSKTPSRRKFLFLGLGTVAFFSIFKFVKPGKKQKTVKMLTQDGRLVEISEDLLPSERKKVTNNEMRNWIKFKK